MRRPLLLLLAVASLGLAACGDREETVTAGESEAIYVTNGEMQYQVQISRQLNPLAAGDRDFLVGLPAGERQLAPEEIWFGVWMRVINKSEQLQRLADEFTIEDTRGRVFRPVELGPDNVFAYRAGVLPSESSSSVPTEDVPSANVYPQPDSAAGSAPTGGALLLFKLPAEALDFRPLELLFTGPAAGGEESSVRLDV